MAELCRCDGRNALVLGPREHLWPVVTGGGRWGCGPVGICDALGPRGHVVTRCDGRNALGLGPRENS